jgi:hypothetical protein
VTFDCRKSPAEVFSDLVDRNVRKQLSLQPIVVIGSPGSSPPFPRLQPNFDRALDGFRVGSAPWMVIFCIALRSRWLGRWSGRTGINCSRLIPISHRSVR